MVNDRADLPNTYFYIMMNVIPVRNMTIANKPDLYSY